MLTCTPSWCCTHWNNSSGCQQHPPVARAHTRAPPVLAMATVHSRDRIWKPSWALPWGATPAAWPNAAMPAIKPPSNPGMPCRFCMFVTAATAVKSQDMLQHHQVAENTQEYLQSAPHAWNTVLTVCPSRCQPTSTHMHAAGISQVELPPQPTCPSLLPQTKASCCKSNYVSRPLHCSTGTTHVHAAGNSQIELLLLPLLTCPFLFPQNHT
jgi:hypothetical protein